MLNLSSLITRNLLILTIVFVPSLLYAKNNYDNSIELFDLPLKDLLNVEIVSAGKKPEKIKEIPANVTIISRKEIEQYGYTTLTDILENVPGMYNIFGYDGVSGNFGMRGLWNPKSQNSNFVILINGVSQLKDDDRSNPFEKITVPTEAIDRIEIIRGPMSVMYGNGAFFGVINIVTNEYTDHDHLASITYGSRNKQKVVLRTVGKKGRFKYTLSASKYKTDGVDNKFSDMTSPENFAMFPGFNLTEPDPSTNGVLENENEYLGFTGSYKNWYFDLSYSKTDAGTFFLLPPLDGGTSRIRTNKAITIGHNRNINDWLNINGRATYNDYHNSAKIDFLVPNTGFQTIDYKSYDIELLATIKPNDNLNMILGLNQRRMYDLKDFVDIPVVGVNDELVFIDDRPTQSIFAQADFNIHEQVKLIAGFRHEVVSASTLEGFVNSGSPSQTTFGGVRERRTNNTPRIAAIYTKDDNNTFKFMYGEAARVSEDSDAPEKLKTFEVNYLYSTRDSHASISLFHNQLEDLLVRVIMTNPNGSVSENNSSSGRQSNTGIEASFNTKLTNQLSGELGATFQRAKNDNNNDIDVAYSPRTVLHGKLTYKNNDHIFSILGRYVGSMEPRFDQTKSNADGSFGAKIGEKVEDYAVIDANYRVENILGGMFFNIKASNIFNEEIRYPNNPFNSEILDRGTLGPGRMLIGTFGWKF